MTTTLEARLKDHAGSLGFSLVGIAPATEADSFDRLQEWLARGYAGEMHYLANRAEARRHPSSILPSVRSVVMLGINYAHLSLEPPPWHGRVARYAQGPDYHQVLWKKLDTLLTWLQTEVPSCNGRGVVDTAPLLERDFARRAGLGWFGKNTMLISRQKGSYLFLAALLIDLELAPDPPHTTSHCGSCTACLEACPTGAFTGPGWLDARKCISYLTIELRSPIPEALRSGIGNWLFGCDVCQEVCPWNRKTPLDGPATFPHRDDLEVLDPIELLQLDEEGFRQRFRATALKRAKRGGLLRNAAIVLGNQGNAGALPVLQQASQDDDPTVAEAAQWAIAQIRQRQQGSSDEQACHR